MAASAPTPKASPKRLLIADDNAYYLTIISDALTEAGYEIQAFSDGHPALEAILRQQGQLDLVILNRDLPGLSGMDIIKRVREGDKKIVMLVMDVFTKKGEEIQELKNSGASGYFNKSIPIEEIVYRINDLLFPPERFSRKNPRAVIYLPVQFTVGAETHQTYSFTLSADGMYLQSMNPPAPRTEMRLSFKLADGSDISIRGRVLYRYKYDPHRSRAILPGMAVTFLDVDHELRTHINRFVVDTLVQSVRAQREALGKDAHATATEDVVTCKVCTGLGKVPYVVCNACGGVGGDCQLCHGNGMNPFIRKLCPVCRGLGSMSTAAPVA